MKFICDFHIHSRFSRATSKSLDLKTLYIASRTKGIAVLGTGDFTHPAWLQEIKDTLIQAEEGLFKLKPEIAALCDLKVPKICRSEMRFMLVTEISNIYKKNGKTRKVHNLVFVPDLESAAKFSIKLGSIGNIGSDGRPILGLDSRNLLEILLETTDRGFFVPAHIWTPWFSLLGSKSGFDSIEECFEDLTPYIHALETGLSSDPAMNWRVSDLDRRTLISNSDAHSPGNLGREANLFNTDLNYRSIIEAMKTGDPEKFLGTLEFYPEEGKYHFDGHRKCETRFHPKETLSNKGKCPVCGKGLTLGVLYRVNALADREEGQKPENSHPFYNIIPLAEILSEIFRVGPRTKKVTQYYNQIIDRLGPELEVLHGVPLEEIGRVGIPLLKEAIERTRKGKILIKPGYDGEFGKIQIFDDAERDSLVAQRKLFDFSCAKLKEQPKRETGKAIQKRLFQEFENENVDFRKAPGCMGQDETTHFFNQLNEQQKQAVCATDSGLLIVAGPGTGKTRTLTYKIAYLINYKKMLPENILAVTFTNKAANEMKSRLKSLLKSKHELPAVGTFHSICLEILKNIFDKDNLRVIDEDERNIFLKEAVKIVRLKGAPIKKKLSFFQKFIVNAKQNIMAPGDFSRSSENSIDNEIFKRVYETYQELLNRENALDYEELIFRVVKLFEESGSVLKRFQEQYKYILVDEYQDLNYGQYRFIRALMPGLPKDDEQPSGICAIGDPDQSIYGFRGSNVKYFKDFVLDYPEARVLNLTRNYRSTETILQVSGQVIEKFRIGVSTPEIFSGIEGISTMEIHESKNETMEAGKIALEIEKLVGGTGFFSMDSGMVEGGREHMDRSFSDIAVLFRTRSQANVLVDVFKKRGIPYQIVTKDSVFGAKGVSEICSVLKIVENLQTISDTKKVNSLFLSVGGGFDTFISEMRQEIQNQSNSRTVKEKLMFLANRLISLDVIKKEYLKVPSWNKVLDFSEEFGKDIHDFFSMAALHTDPDIFSFRSEKVFLSTMHAAKGLEFDVVFISGCENGLIPFKWSDDAPSNLEEERRLFYVAITRAREKLYCTWAETRTIYGKTLSRKLSPFVLDIEKKLRSHKKHAQHEKGKRSQIQLQLF